ncbi:hypothetical protein [Streptomyces sp. KR55]|uniref:hypothetical protein n=1 Tax=Streptomyces sp. KR55 TaxID=3457425 RepID=UPI003FD1AA56
MALEPSGRLVRTPTGFDLILTRTRTYHASVDDVWASVTEPERAATELRLVHHLTSTEHLGATGPAWEYYLDMLTAARTGGPRPDFQDYYPAQKAYFESLA